MKLKGVIILLCTLMGCQVFEGPVISVVGRGVVQNGVSVGDLIMRYQRGREISFEVQIDNGTINDLCVDYFGGDIYFKSGISAGHLFKFSASTLSRGNYSGIHTIPTRSGFNFRFDFEFIDFDMVNYYSEVPFAGDAEKLRAETEYGLSDGNYYTNLKLIYFSCRVPVGVISDGEKVSMIDRSLIERGGDNNVIEFDRVNLDGIFPFYVHDRRLQGEE